jgi:hypothetical protein
MKAAKNSNAESHIPKQRKALLTLLATALLLAVSSQAQNFAIDWSTIDGGGGTSTGGVYSITGTIGQPDAGTMSGGSYSLTWGFWSLISVAQTTGVPLFIQLTPTNTVVVSWPSPSTGYDLEESASLQPTNWTAVAQTPTDNGSTKSVIVPASARIKVYRLSR